jgi:hypothetical protein
MKASETDPRAHLKLRKVQPDEAEDAALVEGLFLALALRGAPGWLLDLARDAPASRT